jgi:Mn-dependent DtxR family transcriptional regulator
MGASPWEVVLMVIYCHGWELDATVDRVKRVSSKFCVKEASLLIRDLEMQGLIIATGDKIILTRRGLSYARRVCEKYEKLCDDIQREVWGETSRQFTTLKRFMRR